MPASTRSFHGRRVAVGEREDRHHRSPDRRTDDRRARPPLEDGEGFHEQGADHRAGRVGAEQHAMPDVGLLGAVMVRVLGHVRLEGGADEERRRAGQHDHPDDLPLGADLGQELARPRETEARRRPWRSALFQMPRVRHVEEQRISGRYRSIDNINTLAPLLPHAYAPVPRPSRPQPRTPPPRWSRRHSAH